MNTKFSAPMASSPASPNHRPFTGHSDGPTGSYVKGNSFSARDTKELFNNQRHHHASSNQIGTLRPEEGLGLSSVEVRFVDDDERDGAIATTSNAVMSRSKEKIGHRRVDRQGEVSYKVGQGFENSGKMSSKIFHLLHREYRPMP